MKNARLRSSQLVVLASKIPPPNVINLGGESPHPAIDWKEVVEGDRPIMRLIRVEIMTRDEVSPTMQAKLGEAPESSRRDGEELVVKKLVIREELVAREESVAVENSAPIRVLQVGRYEWPFPSHIGKLSPLEWEKLMITLNRSAKTSF
ncbi:uncharacterized protein A4U43_C08F26570 [Asparagus officinalis]|nr:uncharacterized protein A4U43_C08F26570 [Asparagus officinalis]